METHLVVDPSVRLAELSETITRQHNLTIMAGIDMVAHAIAVGEALLEAKTLIPPGQFQAWLRTFPHGAAQSTCRNYMRLAYLKDHVDPDLTITSNVQLLRGLEKRNSGTPRVAEEIKREAMRLYALGEFTNTEIANTVGVTKDTIHAWADPEWQMQKQTQANARRQERVVDNRVEETQTEREDLAYTYGEPGRAALTKAVVQLAKVQSKDQTYSALLIIIAICQKWAGWLDKNYISD